MRWCVFLDTSLPLAQYGDEGSEFPGQGHRMVSSIHRCLPRLAMVKKLLYVDLVLSAVKPRLPHHCFNPLCDKILKFHFVSNIVLSRNFLKYRSWCHSTITICTGIIVSETQVSFIIQRVRWQPSWRIVSHFVQQNKLARRHKYKTGKIIAIKFGSPGLILLLKIQVLLEDVGAGIAQSVYGLDTSWTVRGSNPGGGEIFRTRPDRSRGPPFLLYTGSSLR
jgi:hypothetical protein